ncbi:MAG: 8-amino-7-oxononanoate synthase [Candidatus Omnitrophica bacterium]|nr:8-amino-7-oxononanoate synthase [Candidatus Omnitrophota bacterium]
MTVSFSRELGADLKKLRAKKLDRALTLSDPKRFINFSSNNYLGLTTHPRVVSETVRAVRKWGTGSGASRLVSGNLEIHSLLEEKIARFKKEESSLLFSSGYLANLGALTAVAREGDVLLLDRLNHASLIDAAKLSKAKFWVYPHADLKALSGLLDRAKPFRRRWVVTDAYFSMDGDVANLADLRALCRQKNALLMIDEAHSTGVFGKNGGGLTEHFGLSGEVDIVMGTLSKALASSGGFIAGPQALKEYLVNHAREFIYTTAPVPAASAAALAAIEVVEEEPGLREELWRNVTLVREGLKALGFDLLNSQGPIIPIVLGNTARTLDFEAFLMKEGILAPAIRPPTVPAGTDRIRISIMATHSKAELARLLAALKKARKKYE